MAQNHLLCSAGMRPRGGAPHRTMSPDHARPSRRRWRLGLRTRATIGFGVTGFLVALVLAAVTYFVARGYLVDEREQAAEQQTYVNARLSRLALRATDPDIRGLLASFGGGTASDSVLRYRGESFSTSVSSGAGALPPDLVSVVNEGHAGHQRYHDADGDLRLAVGVPITAAEASYFELFELEELEDTLGLLSRSLAIGVLGAAVVAAGVGRIAAGGLVRPLAPVADAAERIADGALDTRLTDVDDPDLRRLADAFNAMAASLESRIEREERFAADVSHELRSPLTAVAAALEIIQRRQDQLPPEVVEAVAVLAEKVDTFQGMTLDLLEISRVDAGTASLALDVIDLQHLISRVLARHNANGASITVDDAAPTHVSGDRRRLAQTMGNIVDNASRYGGGVTAVTVDAPAPGLVRIAFDDRGPGVSSDERDAIFGRFARGEHGVRAGASTGTGLGLSLVVEHVRLHRGRVWVEDNPHGGARFVIELPADSW